MIEAIVNVLGIFAIYVFAYGHGRWASSGDSDSNAVELAMEDAARVVTIDTLVRFIDEHGADGAVDLAEDAVNERLTEAGLTFENERIEFNANDEPAQFGEERR